MSRSEGGHRRHQRHLTELDLELYEMDGAALDTHARAHDISAKGFRAETRAQLSEGQEVQFELILEDGERVRGRATFAWATPDYRGWFTGGAKITKISWRDSGRLQREISTEGYDFVGLMRAMFWVIYWTIVAVGLHNLMHHQPLTLAVAAKLTPVLIALLILGFSLMSLLRLR